MSLAQRKIPASRVLHARSTSDSESGVIGSVTISPGERLAFAVELAGTELLPGASLYSMSAPTLSGDDAANMTVEDYTAHDSQARFEVSLVEEATESDDISVNLVLQLRADEVKKYTVPVVVGS